MSDKEPCGTTVPQRVPFDHLHDNEAYASERGDYSCAKGRLRRPQIGIWKAKGHI